MRQSTYCHLIEQALSPQRLSPYRVSANDTEIEVHARYVWNVALSEALYPSLQAMEDVLRNGIHEQASVAFATPRWFDPSQQPAIPSLRQDEQRQLAMSIAELSWRFGSKGRTVTAGDIVASLSFGFWTGLFNSYYERPAMLWPRLLAPIFSHAVRRERVRAKMEARLRDVRLLRNRVFHYEPIWNRPSLVAQHALIIEMIGWISPAVQSRTLLVDRFSDVWLNGPAPFEAQLAAQIAALPA